MYDEHAVSYELERLMVDSGLPSDHIIGPASKDRIEAAEVALGLKFPMSYRLFLLKYGAIRYGDHEIFGLFDEVVNEDYALTDVVEQTLNYRTFYFDYMPDPSQIIYFAQDQDGTLYYSDSSKSADGRAPVFASTPFFRHRKLTDDFLIFFRQLLQAESEQPFGF